MKVSKDIRKYEVNGICLFAISLSFLGVRYRKQGIKTKEMAYTIAAKVRQDILEGNFDPRKYINADKQNQKRIAGYLIKFGFKEEKIKS